MSYKIYVRDQYLNRVAEVDDYQSLEMIPRFNAPGTWVLEIPTDSIAAKEIIRPHAGIIVVRNGVTVLSGPVANRNRKWDINGDRTTVSGYDDTILLSRRLAYPVPLGPPYASQAYDVRTGIAETIMKEYVDANIGVQARSERQVVNFVSAVNQGLGEIVTGRARFHSLLELLSKLALSGGDLGFRVLQVNQTLEFQVYEPANKTEEVFFSPLLGNLRDFEYSQEDPETNYVIMGGGGEGTARTFVELGHSASISKYGRIESFVDRRDTTDNDELEQSVDEELAEKVAKTSLRISPIDIEGCKFGTDYNLGDKVSIVLTQPGERVNVETIYYFISAYQTVPVDIKMVQKIKEQLEVIQDVVREVKITVNAEGEVITPIVGTPESLSHPIFGIFNRMKKFSNRISNLERR